MPTDTEIQHRGILIRKGTPEQQNNYKLAKSAIKQNVSAYQFISPELQNNDKLVKYLNTEMLRYTSDQIKKNREYALAFVKKDGMALKHLDKSFRNDYEIGIAAVTSNPEALKLLSYELRDHIDIFLATFITYDNDIDYQQRYNYFTWYARFEKYKYLRIFSFVSRRLKRYTGLIKLVFQEGLGIYADLSLKLRRNPEIFKLALDSEWRILNGCVNSIPAQFLEDSETVLKLVKVDGSVILRAPTFMNNRDIVLTALASNGYLYQKLSDEFRDDDEIFLAALDGRMQIQGCYELSMLIKYASERIQNNFTMVLAQLKKNIYAFEYVGDRFKKNLVLFNMSQEKTYTFQFLDESIRSDWNIILDLAQQDICVLKYWTSYQTDHASVLSYYKQFHKFQYQILNDLSARFNLKNYKKTFHQYLHRSWCESHDEYIQRISKFQVTDLIIENPDDYQLFIDMLNHNLPTLFGKEVAKIFNAIRE